MSKVVTVVRAITKARITQYRHTCTPKQVMMTSLTNPATCRVKTSPSQLTVSDFLPRGSTIIFVLTRLIYKIEDSEVSQRMYALAIRKRRRNAKITPTLTNSSRNDLSDRLELSQ